MKFRVKARKDPVIDMINLVDVFLTLLIFFMLSTTFAMAPGIKVNLPKSSADIIARNQKDINIVIGRDGRIVYNKEIMTNEELDKALTAVAAADPNALIIIQADQDTTHGRVVQVMDMAKSKGLLRLAIATQKKD